MNEHEIERIAAAANQLRPDWPLKQLKTLLSDERIACRPRRDVAVALMWVGCEPNSASPYRVLEAGPWWKAAGIESTVPLAKRGPICIHCGFERHDCERRWKTDHAYEGPDDWMRRRPKQETDVPRVIEALKADIAHAPEIAAPKNLDDLLPADRAPNVEAARAALNAQRSTADEGAREVADVDA